MKKKEYITPVIQIASIESPALLAGSIRIKEASEDDYSDDHMENYWDNNKGVWAD